MREHLPPSVTECNMLYLPNIGYILAISKWNPTPPEDFAFPDLELKFSINQVHYYKSASAKGRWAVDDSSSRSRVETLRSVCNFPTGAPLSRMFQSWTRPWATSF